MGFLRKFNASVATSGISILRKKPKVKKYPKNEKDMG